MGENGLDTAHHNGMVSLFDSLTYDTFYTLIGTEISGHI